jgi:fluoroquinolone transport system permease protein
MIRLWTTIKLDMTIQWRNKFYAIGIGLAVLTGLAMSRLLEREVLVVALPMIYLFAVGGTMLIYTAGLLIFEKDQQTLDAMLVSPLRLSEYMASKIITLTILGLVESLIILILSHGLMGVNLGPLLAGLILLSIMMALIGVIMIVRYRSITDFLMPVTLVMFVLEIPVLYFTGLVPTPLSLLIPTGAPTMLMWAGWHALEPWQWVYGFGYSLITIGLLLRWALAAFNHHIILKERG